MDNKRVGIKPNQILSGDIEVKIIGGKAVVTRTQRQGNQIVNKSQEHVPIQTEEQEEVSKMASSAIEEAQRYLILIPEIATWNSLGKKLNPY